MLILECFYAPKLSNHAIHTKLLDLESCDDSFAFICLDFGIHKIRSWTFGNGSGESIGARAPNHKNFIIGINKRREILPPIFSGAQLFPVGI